MTIDHPVRRWLARVCSADTMARVVDPTLADMRVEHARPRWRGYLSLVSALTMHVVASTPSAVARAFKDDDRAIAKVLLFSVIAAILGAAVLIGLPYANVVRRTGGFWLVATLLPQALALTLPAALLLAVPLAMYRRAPHVRLIYRIVVVSALYAMLTFGLIGWVVPESNQAFRIASSGNSQLERGLSEFSLHRMQGEIGRLKTFHGGDRIVREIEFEYEIRLALSAAAVPLALLAIAFALTSMGRRHPLVMGALSVGIYVAMLFAFETTVQRPLLLSTTTAVGTIAWIPNAALVLLAGLVAAAARRREIAERCA
jgi:hypothetical protein